MFVGTVAAVIAAVLIGFPTFRLAGIYFALATLAYPLILRIVMEFLGYQEVPIPMVRVRPGAFMQFRDPRAYDLLALGALTGTLVLSHWIETSRLGYALRALRENEQAAEAAGIDTFQAKMTAYMLSAAPAAVIGAIYAHAILFVVTPDAVFGTLVIVQTLVVCLVGGVGTRLTAAGAAIIVRERDARRARRHGCGTGRRLVAACVVRRSLLCITEVRWLRPARRAGFEIDLHGGPETALHAPCRLPRAPGALLDILAPDSCSQGVLACPPRRALKCAPARSWRDRPERRRARPALNVLNGSSRRTPARSATRRRSPGSCPRDLPSRRRRTFQVVRTFRSSRGGDVWSGVRSEASPFLARHRALGAWPTSGPARADVRL